ncbi:Lrp/AsnC family transcriptional regulator [Candidatus Woesearchaeota archaeon]|nr:Lrp/AsnC family transcriptional regulator [Candidatus Woesearchaeota archaeon]
MEWDKMFSKKDVEILSHLRNNARKRITSIARETNIPATTIYDKVRIHEKKGLVKKSIALLDFSKLGYLTNAHFAVRAKRDSRKNLQEFLMSQPNINSLYKVDYGFDFLFEAVFKDLADAESFAEKLEENFDVEEIKKFHVIEELKKEEFLSKPEHFELV